MPPKYQRKTSSSPLKGNRANDIKMAKQTLADQKKKAAAEKQETKKTYTSYNTPSSGGKNKTGSSSYKGYSSYKGAGSAKGAGGTKKGTQSKQQNEFQARINNAKAKASADPTRKGSTGPRNGNTMGARTKMRNAALSYAPPKGGAKLDSNKKLALAIGEQLSPVHGLARLATGGRYGNTLGRALYEQTKKDKDSYSALDKFGDAASLVPMGGFAGLAIKGGKMMNRGSDLNKILKVSGAVADSKKATKAGKVVNAITDARKAKRANNAIRGIKLADTGDGIKDISRVNKALTTSKKPFDIGSLNPNKVKSGLQARDFQKQHKAQMALKMQDNLNAANDLRKTGMLANGVADANRLGDVNALVKTGNLVDGVADAGKIANVAQSGNKALDVANILAELPTTRKAYSAVGGIRDASKLDDITDLGTYTTKYGDIPRQVPKAGSLVSDAIGGGNAAGGVSNGSWFARHPRVGGLVKGAGVSAGIGAGIYGIGKLREMLGLNPDYSDTDDTTDDGSGDGSGGGGGYGGGGYGGTGRDPILDLINGVGKDDTGGIDPNNPNGGLMPEEGITGDPSLDGHISQIMASYQPYLDAEYQKIDAQMNADIQLMREQLAARGIFNSDLAISLEQAIRNEAANTKKSLYAEVLQQAVGSAMDFYNSQAGMAFDREQANLANKQWQVEQTKDWEKFQQDLAMQKWLYS